MVEYRVKGAMFENEKDVGPAFTGFVEIDGVKTFVALWPKTSAKGQNYLQVSEDKKQAQKAAAAPARSPFKPKIKPPSNDDPFGDGGDSIPFAPEFR